MHKISSGRINLQWTGLEGEYSFGTNLKLVGELATEGFPHISSAILFVTIRVKGLKTCYGCLLGISSPVPVSLGPNSSQGDGSERRENIIVPVQIDVASIENIENARQGDDFSLILDTKILIFNYSPPKTSEVEDSPIYSLVNDQQDLKIASTDWAQKVLQSWDRGVGIPIVIALPEVALSQERKDIARFLKEAWQKIDAGDYQGAFVEARKSIELIRKMTPSDKQIPASIKDRDISQRFSAVTQALFNLGSAASHTDEAILNYTPSREDAVALVGSAAALAQAVFARLKSGGQ